MTGPLIGKFGTFEYSLAERYRFESELGRGGMGTVYRARDVRHPRMVAIKMLHASLTNDYGVLRFQKEIEIAAQLQHPHIVRLLDSGVADGRLFYVMEYLDGVSLRDKLKQEPQLSVEESLKITQQVGEALQYAHDRGIVHRDVKPENIIIADGRAHVVDFGLARALSAADAERLTASGLAVGTPHYMAPEQGAGERKVGPFADQYALACVLYEMLVGEPPFTGPSATAVATRHQVEVPVALCVRRKTTPKHVDTAVMKALEKVPTDRYSTISTFVSACARLHATEHVFGPSLKRPRLSLMVQTAIGLIAILVSGVLASQHGRSALARSYCAVSGSCLDSNSVVIVAVGNTSAGGDTAAMLKLIHAMSRWRGFSISQAASRVSSLESPEAITLASERGSGRVITAAIARHGDGFTVDAELRDVRTSMRLRQSTLTVSASDPESEEGYSRAAYALLFPEDSLLIGWPDASGTQSRAAMQAYLRAKQDLDSWRLPAAQNALASAITEDLQFAAAHLLLAQVELWRSDSAPELLRHLELASGGRALLNPRQRLQLAAMLDLQAGRFPSTCARFDSLIVADSMDFAAWYGRGECHRRDDGVVADVSSPSGYRFRTSVRAAQMSIARAFRIIGPIDTSTSDRVDSVFSRLLYVRAAKLRVGHAVNEHGSFAAYPQWLGDTIGFVPYAAERVLSGDRNTVPSTHALAIENQRLEFFRLAQRELSYIGARPRVLERFGLALELINDPAAIDTLRSARSIATNKHDQLRLATLECFVRLKTALPSQPSELSAVRFQAESLLTNTRTNSAEDAIWIASLAALVGDANRAAATMASVSVRLATAGVVPANVANDAEALLAFAALAGPVDSLAAVENRLVRGIKTSVVPQRRQAVLDNLLGRAATLAFPRYRAAAFAELDPNADYLVALEKLFVANQYDAVRQRMSSLRRTRAALSPSDIALETVLPETWILNQIGDTATARAQLNATLDGIDLIPSRELATVASIGSLAGLVEQRAEFDERNGRHAAASRWANALIALSDSTYEQGRARIERMRLLTGGPSRK